MAWTEEGESIPTAAETLFTVTVDLEGNRGGAGGERGQMADTWGKQEK